MAEKPEEKARKNIDRQLAEAGWKVQDRKKINLSAGIGVAVREMNVGSGFADYLLYADGIPVGIIEAKKEGVVLENVADQSDKYIAGIPKRFKSLIAHPRFVYESTGSDTRFRDLADPGARQRGVFHFHTPETLRQRMEGEATLRKSLGSLPPLNTKGLRECQIEAVNGLEKAFAAAAPRSLIQMATGSGKTYTAVTFVYRLIKFADAKRILFLVDRKSLGVQALREFQQFIPPDTSYNFTDLYNVQHLASHSIDPVSGSGTFYADFLNL